MRKLQLGRPSPGGEDDWQKKTFKEIEDASAVPDVEHAQIEARLRYWISTAVKGAILRIVYPVKCIYITTDARNPRQVFGFGTWTAFGAGRVPVGFLNADPDFGTIEATGGEKTHALTPSEAPPLTAPANAALTGAGVRVQGYTGTNGAAHNNLQPFIVVFMWKRTA